MLSSDSRKMSKYEKKKQRSSVLDLHSLLKSLALYIRKWVVLFTLNFLTFYSSPVLREWPSACSLQPFPLLAGHCVSEASCLQASDKRRAAFCGRGAGKDVSTRSLFQPDSSLCLHKARFPVMARSIWYLVSGLLFWAGTLENTTVSTRNTSEWVPWSPYMT